MQERIGLHRNAKSNTPRVATSFKYKYIFDRVQDLQCNEFKAELSGRPYNTYELGTSMSDAVQMQKPQLRSLGASVKLYTNLVLSPT